MPTTNFAYLPIGVVVYFCISWFFPWNLIQFDSSISISYLFDVIFSLSVLFLLQKSASFGRFDKTKTFIRFFFIALFGFICVVVTKYFKILAPFRYVDNLAAQILLLAPIIEEFVFRGALYELGTKSRYRVQLNLGVNAVLFSLSHAPALWYLGEEFHTFIYFQMAYTLVLGWVCAKSRHESGGVAEPILLHFLFNFIFYLAVTSYGL